MRATNGSLTIMMKLTGQSYYPVSDSLIGRMYMTNRTHVLYLGIAPYMEVRFPESIHIWNLESPNLYKGIEK